jgi:superfamily II DNA/RNA helicase
MIKESELHPTIKHKLSENKVLQFTPIQAATVSSFVNKVNFVGLASTGSGKTMAFLLPVISRMLNHPGTSTLIVTPTRELANQIYRVAQLYTAETAVIPLLLIGGTSVRANEVALSRKPNLIIGTPGRIKHHLGLISKLDITTLIFDEVDQMLTIGFKDEFNKFMEAFKNDTVHKVFFSATLPHKTKDLLRSHVPEVLVIDVTNESVKPIIKEEHIRVSADGKPAVLLQIAEEASSALIFVNTKHQCRNIQKILRSGGHESRILNGDLSSAQRARSVKDFSNLTAPFLIATDVASRGLDFKDLPVVINYDIPPLANSYVHRIGRTGRTGAEGIAYSLIAPKEEVYIQRIKSFTVDNILIKDDRPRGGARRPSFGSSAGGSRSPYTRSFSHSSKKPFGSRTPSSFTKKPSSFTKKPRPSTP